ncbi:hypothetical protein [uncultured Mucilaginibacter sp.]|uniref:hypothetical protein n=1 Tax=uncultured Mucilaginibacter sp. TaxID=797541 RepID=UPI0025F19F83|nr:hypothetical protein [uncultured Mucilaginibacter sp.]
MIKWFAYVCILLIFAPSFLSAKIKNRRFNVITYTLGIPSPFKKILTDTTKNPRKTEADDKKKIKEVAKAKKQPKPEKIETGDNATSLKPKPKPKRQRRPEGLERPPEIPRRNGN